MAILSIPMQSLNPYYAWDACASLARCRQSRKAVWVVAATTCFQSPTFPLQFNMAARKATLVLNCLKYSRQSSNPHGVIFRSLSISKAKTSRPSLR